MTVSLSRHPDEELVSPPGGALVVGLGDREPGSPAPERVDGSWLNAFRPTGGEPFTQQHLRWAGFGGVLLLTAAAWGLVAVPEPTPVLATLLLAAGISGIGVLVVAWMRLGASAVALPSCRWLTGTLALWCAPLLMAPPLFSRDVFSYLAQGETAARRLDPGAVSPVDALGSASAVVARVDGHWQDTLSPYGPLFTAVERQVAQTSGGDLVTGVLLHRVVALLGLGLVVWAFLRLAARTGASPSVALWLGALNPLVLWHLVAGVHNDALMLGLMLAGTVLALEALDGQLDRWQLALGVALVGCAAMVKLPAVVALAVVATAVARRRGGSVRDLVGAAFGAALALLVVGGVVQVVTGVGAGWLRALGTSGQVDSWMAPTNWPGFLVAAVTGDGAQLAGTAISAGRAVGALLAVCGIAVVIVGQLRGRIGDVAALGAVMALVVVLGPVVQPWYLLWAVLPLAAACLAGRARGALVVVVAVFSVVVPPLAGDFTGRVGQLVVAYVLAVAVLGAALVLAHRAGAVRQRVPDRARVCSR